MKLKVRSEVTEYLMHYTNSGALIQLSWRQTPTGVVVYDATCVEASASSHVAPAYPRSAEAIRVSPSWSRSRVNREWREWIEDVVRKGGGK